MFFPIIILEKKKNERICDLNAFVQFFVYSDQIKPNRD